ncbi:hypothetical protein B0909_24560 [Rhizobium rhizogenes]|nr:hypothetical protein B0909_24560 [Rhizobium rhizogenes]
MGMRACCLAKASTRYAYPGAVYDPTNSCIVASVFPHSCACHRNPAGAAFAWREESFQPKDLGWLDSCDKHRSEGETAALENRPLPTVPLLRPHGLSWQEPAATER